MKTRSKWKLSKCVKNKLFLFYVCIINVIFNMRPCFPIFFVIFIVLSIFTFSCNISLSESKKVVIKNTKLLATAWPIEQVIWTRQVMITDN